MEIFVALGALIFIGAVFYLIYHFIRKIKNRDRVLPKKKFYPVLVGGFSLMILGAALTDTQSIEALNNAQELNESLTIKVDQLEVEVKELQEVIDEADKVKQEEIDALIKDHEESIKSIKEDHDAREKELSEKITSLEEANANLEKEMSTLKEQAAAKAKEAATNTSNGGSSGSSSSSSSSSSSNNASSNSLSTNSSDCNIKGSVNGIYHTTSSRSYNRTKNVVQWFCSVEEAQAAGYRAPQN